MEIEALQKIFAEGLLEAREERGQGIIVVSPEIIHQVLKFCKEDQRFKMNMLLDVVGVDYHTELPRFEVVYILYSVDFKKRLLVKVRIPDGIGLPTAIDLWRSADWAEREVWDMFGIPFMGHPNLKRILMYEGFKGHPLRKDYPVNRRQQIPEIEEVP